jgi:hypothetical protein
MDDGKKEPRLNPPSPYSGSRLPIGRPKGVPNRATRTIREAIELACKPGACHPRGLAGWLIERATGGVEDRKIFAGLVAKVVPAQLHATVDHVTVQLPWLAGRSVVGTHRRTQSGAYDAQVIDTKALMAEDLRVTNPIGDAAPVLEPAFEPVESGQESGQAPPPPLERQAGGGSS